MKKETKWQSDRGTKIIIEEYKIRIKYAMNSFR